MEKIIQSFKNNKKGIIIMIVASLLTALGQLFWKLFQEQRSIYFLIIGFFLYGLGAVTMIIALKNGKHSVIHPMMCTGYIFALLLGAWILNEYINYIQFAGILFMMTGVVFVGGGDE